MKTTANNSNNETKKFYVIASSEYEANMPDLFIMNETASTSEYQDTVTPLGITIPSQSTIGWVPRAAMPDATSTLTKWS